MSNNDSVNVFKPCTSCTDILVEKKHFYYIAYLGGGKKTFLLYCVCVYICVWVPTESMRLPLPRHYASLQRRILESTKPHPFDAMWPDGNRGSPLLYEGRGGVMNKQRWQHSKSKKDQGWVKKHLGEDMEFSVPWIHTFSVTQGGINIHKIWTLPVTTVCTVVPQSRELRSKNNAK